MKKHILSRYTNVTIIFLIITLLMVLPLWRPHQMIVQGDWAFHASRVEQIFRNLQQHKFLTFISTSTFQQSGAGSFLFYPTIFLYPWALLRFFFSPLSSFYIWFSIIIFLTFMISFVCMDKFSKSRLQSFVFALFFTLAPYHLYLAPSEFVLGEFIAVTFIPIVFLGYYDIFCANSKSWYLLPIGLGLVTYSHILSTFILVEIMFVLTLIKLIIQRNVLSYVTPLIKSIFLYTLLVSPMIVLFATDFINQDVYSANKGLLLLYDADNFILTSLTNKVSATSIGIVLLITSLLSYRLIKKDAYYRLFYFCGITLLLISTSIFPWRLISQSIFSTIQFPWRYLTYAIFFLSLVASKIIALTFSKSGDMKYSILIYSLTAVIMLVGYYGSVSDVILRNRDSPANTSLTNPSKSEKVSAIPSPTLINNNNYQTQFLYLVNNGETDYYPLKAYANKKSILNHVTLINNRQFDTPSYTTEPNKLSTTLTCLRNCSIDLPIVKYKHTVVSVNNQKIRSYSSQRGTVQFKVKKGINHISISYQPPIMFYLALLISSISWIVIVLNFFWRRTNNKKRTLSAYPQSSN